MSGLIAVVAMARNRVIGAEGTIPWHLPEDLKFFQRLTLGQVVVMGRKTYASIGRPLPGRENWVITTSDLAKDPHRPALRLLSSPQEVPDQLPDGRQIFVIGGATIYAALLPRCRELYLTLVEREVDGDTLFPVCALEQQPGALIHQGEGFTITHHRFPAPNAAT